MAVIVKFYCEDGEIFRRHLEEPSFDAIVRLAVDGRPDVTDSMLRAGKECALKYADDEGDLCTLAPATFDDFLQLQRENSRLLKLTLKLPKASAQVKDAMEVDAERTLPEALPEADAIPVAKLASVCHKRTMEESVQESPLHTKSGKAKGKGKKGKKGRHGLANANLEEPAPAEPAPAEPADIPASEGPAVVEKEETPTVTFTSFTDTDGDVILLQLEGEKVVEYVNGKLSLPNMAYFHIDVASRTYRDEGGTGRFKDDTDVVALKAAVEKLFAKVKDAGDSTDGCPWQWGAWGFGGPRKLMGTLRMLRAAGILTAEMLASLGVQWLPWLTQMVARKMEKINRMARDGLDETLLRMLKVIQEQAAATPGLEAHSAGIAEALNGDGQRRLGESLYELLQALNGLAQEVQVRFFDGLASALLPLLEELELPSCGNGKGKGKKGKCGKGWKGWWKGCHWDDHQMEEPATDNPADKTSENVPVDEKEDTGDFTDGCPWQWGPQRFTPARLMRTVLRDWPMFAKGKGKGKCGKGWKGWWKGCPWDDKMEEPAADVPQGKDEEFQAKVAQLMELQIAGEEVVKELLIAHDGDVTAVMNLLTS